MTALAEPLDRVGAAALTARIRTAADDLWRLIAEAHERKAWAALGYASFRAYVDEEFDLSKSAAYRLLAKAQVVREITAAAGAAGDRDVEAAVARAVPERAASAARKALPAAKKSARASAARGAEPAAAAEKAIRKLPAMPPAAPAPDPDRARRAAEYAERTGRPARAAGVAHCRTCRCYEGSPP